MMTGILCIMTAVLSALLMIAKGIQPPTIVGNMSHHDIDGTIRVCKAILEPDFCPAGHEILPCIEAGERDQCLPCQEGYENLDTSFSDIPIECYAQEECPEGTVRAPRNTASVCNMPCKCDTLSGYIGQDPCSCQRVSQDLECGEDTYLDQINEKGVCLQCEKGTYKPGNGYGPCIPKLPDKGSLGNSTQVSKSLPTNGTKITGKFLDAKPSNVKSTESDGPDRIVEDRMDNEVEKNQNITAWKVAVPCVGVVLVALCVLGLFFYCWRHRRNENKRSVSYLQNESSTDHDAFLTARNEDETQLKRPWVAGNISVGEDISPDTTSLHSSAKSLPTSSTGSDKSDVGDSAAARKQEPNQTVVNIYNYYNQKGESNVITLK